MFHSGELYGSPYFFGGISARSMHLAQNLPCVYWYMSKTKGLTFVKFLQVFKEAF
jgi:hypothetical protein